MDACEEGRPRYCSSADEVVVGPVCADLGLGLECAADEYGGVLCRGSERACELSPDLAPPYQGDGCAGDDLEICIGGGMSRYSCPSLAEGVGCFESPGDGGPLAFCGYGDFCEPSDQSVDCDGTTVIFCDLGRIGRFDCTALGFTGCNERTGCAPSPYAGGADCDDFDTRCEGDLEQECQNREWSGGRDCTACGGYCYTNEVAADSYCVCEGDDCTDGELRCGFNDTIEQCSQHRWVYQEDCYELCGGGTCELDADSNPQCACG